MLSTEFNIDGPVEASAYCFGWLPLCTESKNLLKNDEDQDKAHNLFICDNR